MITRTLIASALCVSFYSMSTPKAHAGPDPFIGEIIMTGYNFCPRGWAAADGQLLPIAQNTALFSLYGTTYGGDGRTTFGLPDLRGRTALHAGAGPGLSPIRLGQKGGVEETTPKKSNLTGVESKDGERLASAERPVMNRAPYTGVRYCVALQGVYPSRS